MTVVKEVEATLMPRLRFPEFRESGAWKPIKLGSVLTFQVGFPFPSKGFTEEGRGLRLIRNRDLRSSNKPVYYADPYSDDFVVSDGDILVGMDGDFTPCVWDGGDALLNQRVGRVLPKPKNHKRFLLYFLTAHLKAIEDSTARTTVKHLSHSDVEKICEPLPQGREQQKIADCLTSLDEVIAAQGRKVEALKTHKHGLMQELFPREGETRPRLRFPEFRNALEWKQETLGETADVLMCKRIFASETNAVAGVPFYKIGTLGGVPDAYISKALFEDYRSRYNFPRVGEILITCSGTVGKCLRYDGSDAYFQDSNIVWIDNPADAISNDFLFAVISNVDWSKLNSTTIRRIYGPDLRGLSIKYPKDGSEQKRIACCLSSLDTQIAAESNQLAALKTHKQGLMQQLFPAPETAGA